MGSSSVFLFATLLALGHCDVFPQEEEEQLRSNDKNIVRLSAAKSCADAGVETTRICSGKSTIEICTNGTSSSMEECKAPTPYCDPATITCVAEETAFECPRAEGYFPDLHKCNVFYYCLNGSAHRFECPVSLGISPFSPASVYDPKLQSCVRQTLQRTCHRFPCGRRNGRMVPYPPDHSIYALCEEGNPVKLMACDENQLFNENAQKCEMECTQEGRMVDPANCRGFYECIAVNLRGVRYNMTSGLCPEGAMFHPEKLVCSKSNSDCP